jgi:hypothetical protein
MESIGVLDLNSVKSSNILNNQEVSKWLQQNQIGAFKSNKVPLLSSLKSKLRSLFGKYAQTFAGSDYKLYVWHLKHNNTVINVFTGNGYGTSYEVVLDDDPSATDWSFNNKKGNEVINFLTELDKLLN